MRGWFIKNRVGREPPFCFNYNPISFVTKRNRVVPERKVFLSPAVCSRVNKLLRCPKYSAAYALNILTAAPNLARCFAHWARFVSFAPYQRGLKRTTERTAISILNRHRSGRRRFSFYLVGSVKSGTSRTTFPTVNLQKGRIISTPTVDALGLSKRRRGAPLCAPVRKESLRLFVCFANGTFTQMKAASCSKNPVLKF